MFRLTLLHEYPHNGGMTKTSDHLLERTADKVLALFTDLGDLCTVRRASTALGCSDDLATEALLLLRKRGEVREVNSLTRFREFERIRTTHIDLPAPRLEDAIRDVEVGPADNERFLDGEHTVLIASWTYEERTRRSQRDVLVEVVCYPGSGQVHTLRNGVLYPISSPERYGPLPDTMDEQEVLREWTARFRLNRPHPNSDGQQD